MIILPAIDIIDGSPVRLYQGDYGKKEVVAESVLTTAETFAKTGASWVHMVDLDGAKAGKRINSQLIAETARTISSKVEVGGGIRTMADIEYYLHNGISRVILGTAAIEDPVLLKEAVQKYGNKIAVGLDCKDGYAMGAGWLKGSSMYYTDFAKELEKIGVSTVIFTDISKDGTLSGPNFAMLAELQKSTSMNIIASGGIRDITHIQKLTEMGLYGAICGKSIYAGSLSLKEALAEGEGKC